MSETSTEQGPPLAVPATQSDPPGKPVTDVVAWIMVAAPLPAPFIDFALLRGFGIEPSSRLVPLAYMLFYLVFGLTDANRMRPAVAMSAASICGLGPSFSRRSISSSGRAR